MTDKGPRETLLGGAIDYVAHNGITDLSLRQLAGALGTSHRMLIHHFGSKEGLWVAIVHEVEGRQRAILADLVPAADVPVADAMRAWWRHISDPSLWPNERLFFELYGQAHPGAPPHGGDARRDRRGLAGAGRGDQYDPRTARASRHGPMRAWGSR